MPRLRGGGGPHHRPGRQQGKALPFFFSFFFFFFLFLSTAWPPGLVSLYSHSALARLDLSLLILMDCCACPSLLVEALD